MTSKTNRSSAEIEAEIKALRREARAARKAEKEAEKAALEAAILDLGRAVAEAVGATEIGQVETFAQAFREGSIAIPLPHEDQHEEWHGGH